MSRVYVPNKAGHDYAAAERFGELVFVTEGPQPRYAVNALVERWREVLADSSPEDYILISSLPILCVLGAALFAARHGKLNLLLFRDGRYLPRNVVLEERG